MLTPQNSSHRVSNVVDDGKPWVFKWHFPKGTFEKRMSAWELAQFILPFMPSIMPFLSHHPRMHAEFQAMLVMLATSPRAAIDRLLPWIRSVRREADDEWIELGFHMKEAEKNPVHFTMSQRF